MSTFRSLVTLPTRFAYGNTDIWFMRLRSFDSPQIQATVLPRFLRNGLVVVIAMSSVAVRCAERVIPRLAEERARVAHTCDTCLLAFITMTLAVVATFPLFPTGVAWYVSPELGEGTKFTFRHIQPRLACYRQRKCTLPNGHCPPIGDIVDRVSLKFLLVARFGSQPIVSSHSWW